mmetsp:Transcript_5287/g.14813  ORF Transcript_5287/g.14813 Transcript_5287/m.14813 type:complete len:217 (+) Transcript_5287:21-671(+)
MRRLRHRQRGRVPPTSRCAVGQLVVRRVLAFVLATRGLGASFGLRRRLRRRGASRGRRWRRFASAVAVEPLWRSWCGRCIKLWLRAIADRRHQRSRLQLQRHKRSQRRQRLRRRCLASRRSRRSLCQQPWRQPFQRRGRRRRRGRRHPRRRRRRGPRGRRRAPRLGLHGLRRHRRRWGEERTGCRRRRHPRARLPRERWWPRGRSTGAPGRQRARW